MPVHAPDGNGDELVGKGNGVILTKALAGKSDFLRSRFKPSGNKSTKNSLEQD
jgi:hypothetical protein